MKYLKTYTKLFESIDNNIKKDIEDISIELMDCGVDYVIKDVRYWNNDIASECLAIELKGSKDSFFRLQDIMDVLLRLNDYVQETNYSIDLARDKDDTYLPIEEFIEVFSGEELYELEIYIYDNTLYKE